MFGITLMAAGTALEEVSSSIGKMEMRKKVETPFSYGVLTMGISLVLFAITAFIRLDAQAFNWASWPTTGLHVLLSVLQATITIYAIKYAERSTFGFLRTLTIPFLLVADMFLAYQIDWIQIVGIGLIVFALFLLFINHGFSKRGRWLSLGSALNSVATISLYKYNITHFNSPEVEMVIVIAVLFAYFVAMSFWFDHSNPFKLFRRPICLAQAGLLGAGAVIDSFSYLFAVPSVLLAAKRTTAIFTSVVLGKSMFAEKHVALKVTAFAICAVGFVLLAF